MQMNASSGSVRSGVCFSLEPYPSFRLIISMKKESFPFAWSVLLVLLALLHFPSHAQNHRYFPEVGREAVHQRALDLSSNAVVLMVALQPGYEDLNLLARLRMGLGAKTFVMYWTNGESTPDDAEGGSPGLLAAERREEAFRASALLGAQAHYLNLPDPGVVSRKGVLASYWNPDSTLAKLVPLIRSYAPDVVVIGGDLRGDTVQSLRQRTLAGLMLAAVKRAAEGKGDNLHPGPWRVQRILVQEASESERKEPGYDQIHPLWKVSYRSIGEDAGREYKTLRYQLPSWLRRGDRSYVQMFPRSAPAPKQLTAGVPAFTSRLKSLAAVVRTATGSEAKGVRSASLDAVTRAIDSLNLFLAKYRATLVGNELRVVSSWKNGLEDLRCSLLDVSIRYRSSDSLVTQSQIFYLRFTGFSSRTSKTHTRIFFPGVMEKKWAINESSTYEYDFAIPAEYRVITPNPMDFNVPGSQMGITRPFARNRFSFLVYHQDSLAGKDFVYRGELLLRSGPRRTFELLTPAVRAIEGEPVVFRLQNISRDAFEGSISLADSILNTKTKAMFLSRKDEVLVDTLSLSFNQPPPSGTSVVTLSLSGGGGDLPVVIRRFEAAVDSSSRIVLLSDIQDSPLTQAMHRLRVPFVRVNSVQPDILESANVLIVDRDELAGKRLAPAQVDSLHAWVSRGGHLLVFPQASSEERGSSLVPWASFLPGPLSAPDDSLVVSSENGLLAGPNALTQADWSNWVVSRSMWSLRVVAGQSGEVVARTARGNIPLLLTRKEERGRVTLVALDLASQLVNLHPGVHRLLGNLLRTSGD